MYILNKTNKPDSNIAWSCAAFCVTKKDEQLLIDCGVLKVHGNRASLVGDPELVPNFSKDTTGAYTVPAGNRLIGVKGQVADRLAILQAEADVKTAQFERATANPELAKLFA